MYGIENLTSMGIFACVVECLSFTDAAKLLGMSKSSVSREISTLEIRLGESLLKRTTRKIEITEFGLNYYQYCFKILNELKESESFVKGYYEKPAGTIAMLAPTTFGIQCVVPTLNSFLSHNIHAKIDLDLSDKIIDIKNSSYDIAIHVSQDTPLHEHCKFIGSIQWGLYATPRYIAQIKKINAPSDLPTRDFLLFRGIARTLSLSFKREKQRVDISVQSRFRSNNSIALMSMALSDFGIAYLPNYVASEYLALGKLERILPNWSMDEYKIWLLLKTKDTLTSSVKNFTSELQKCITKDRVKDNQ
ncbi:TPA: LysR family transcriptional regulator [Providencia stuartii]|uniref:LysR family transcriptional regulator n=1 Tax=Providencia stuartii TaxID=588 RepID=A0AAJ1JGV5_PROST|nr:MULTISPECIES: LysR family transcriptional regulator [Providencia]SST03861.1 Putative transcriptional regulator [Acinetobacter baumannii]AMG68012.1 LysR family transcriptional regulator [Providencia stuartii]EMA3642004.1 LysR family transcriptional regulator [Providencia stuartii]KSX92899.1 LysR family transcriptional regulator [Providencia stuartii]MBN5561341.1 LysR family transcriptional regulator [Providencia stuartii]